MNKIHFTDEELALTKNAMHSYLNTFGHDESEVHATIRSVIAKLNASELETEDPVFLG